MNAIYLQYVCGISGSIEAAEPNKLSSIVVCFGRRASIGDIAKLRSLEIDNKHSEATTDNRQQHRFAARRNIGRKKSGVHFIVHFITHTIWMSLDATCQRSSQRWPLYVAWGYGRGAWSARRSVECIHHMKNDLIFPSLFFIRFNDHKTMKIASGDTRNFCTAKAWIAEFFSHGAARFSLSLPHSLSLTLSSSCLCDGVEQRHSSRPCVRYYYWK